MGRENFGRPVVDTISRRGGNICSNPDCAALTSGPAEDITRAINVGEAAHIYGARPGAARFDAAMSDSDRSEIINAIWLCRNCHKMVDADPGQHPAELLFEWRRTHERSVMDNLGKAGALLRYKVLERRLVDFEKESYLAQQMVIDKPDHWEYKLTAELLRSKLGPIKSRWEALEAGLYALPTRIINDSELLTWFSSHSESLSGQTNALNGLFNGELQRSWGPPGEPGSEAEILRVCSLIAEAGGRILNWEEAVRFAIIPDEVKTLQSALVGIGGRNLERVFEVPIWLNSIFSEDRPSGTYDFTVLIDLPDGWVEQCKVAFAELRSYIRNR